MLHAFDCYILRFARLDRIIDNPDAYFLAGVIFEKLTLPLTSIDYYKK